jgi:integral membrane protein
MTTTAVRRPTVVRRFRAVALLEAATYVLLVVTAVARRVSDLDLVPLVGPVHGVVFLVYVALALRVAGPLRWAPAQTMVVVVAAVIPLGGLYVGRRLLPEGSTADPVRP